MKRRFTNLQARFMRAHGENQPTRAFIYSNLHGDPIEVVKPEAMAPFEFKGHMETIVQAVNGWQRLRDEVDGIKADAVAPSTRWGVWGPVLLLVLVAVCVVVANW